MRRLLRPAMAVVGVALVIRVDPILGVAAGLAAWAVVSWWWPVRAIETVEIDKHHPERAFHGEQVEIVYRVESTRRVPWISIVDVVPLALGPSIRWVTAVEPSEPSERVVPLVATRRGLHSIGPTVVTSGDVFAGRRVQGRGSPATTLLVYPRLVGIDRLGLSARALDQLQTARRALLSDPSRVVGVREYTTGDSLRSIHWTATARTGDLQVKKLDPATSRSVQLIVDLSTRSHPAPGRRRSAELSITAAASIADHLVAIVDETVALRSWCTDSPTGFVGSVERGSGRGPSHLAGILECLARAELTRSTADGSIFDTSGLPFGSAVVLFAGVVSRDHVVALTRLRRLGYDVSVVSTASDRHGDPWSAELDSVGVAVSRIGFYQEVASL